MYDFRRHAEVLLRGCVQKCPQMFLQSLSSHSKVLLKAGEASDMLEKLQTRAGIKSAASESKQVKWLENYGCVW